MELKRIVAEDSNTALKSVKDECGEEALIVSTNRIGQKTEVIYAIDDSEMEIEKGDSKKSSVQRPSTLSNFSDSMRKELCGEEVAKARPDMNSLLSEIRREIRSLRAKIDENHTIEMPVEEGISSALKLSERSLLKRIELLSRQNIEDQGPWPVLNILISPQPRPNATLTRSILEGIKKSSGNGDNVPTVARLYKPNDPKYPLNCNFLYDIHSAYMANAQLLITPELASVERLLEQNIAGCPFLLDLNCPTDHMYEEISDLASRFSGRIMFAINCDQAIESVAIDLSRIPEQFGSLLLHSERKEIACKNLIHELAHSSLEISNVITSLEEQDSQ